MADRVAILLDGGFVTKKLSAQLGRFPNATDVRALIDRVLAEPCLASRELLRVYYYDAPPITDSIRHPIDGRPHDFAASRAYARNLALQRDLAHLQDFALRQGELVFKGWRLRPPALDDLLRSPRALRRDDVVPELEQKGVDLRIGLDVASLAVRRIVDTIVLMSGDSDFVPALKFARREGVRVILDALGHGIRAALFEHADLVIDSSAVRPPGRRSG